MTNKTIEANEKLARIMKIKKELLEIFTEVEFQNTRYHHITFLCDGVEITLTFMDAISLVQENATSAFIYNATKSRPDNVKSYYFRKAYQAKLVTSNKDYKKYSLNKLKEMVEQAR